MNVAKHKDKLSGLHKLKKQNIGSLQKLRSRSKWYKNMRKHCSGYALKRAHSQNSVIYLDTIYLRRGNSASYIDLTKSDTDVMLTKHEKKQQRRPSRSNLRSNSIITIQSIHKLACASSEDIGLAQFAKNIFLNTNVYNYYEPNIVAKEASTDTNSNIQLRRTYPFTSVSKPDVPNNDSNEDTMPEEKLLYLYDVSNKKSEQSMDPSEADEFYALDLGMFLDLYGMPFDRRSL